MDIKIHVVEGHVTILFWNKSSRGVKNIRLNTENKCGNYLSEMLWPKASPLDLCFVPWPSLSSLNASAKGLCNEVKT